jgi:hypothetical protein
MAVASGGDSGSSSLDNTSSKTNGSSTNQQQSVYLEKKLKLAEDKNDALKNIILSKDDELERVL